MTVIPSGKLWNLKIFQSPHSCEMTISFVVKTMENH
ncbi:MAG: hypothetical protein HW406_2793 [Candidatus Brocadiaceae bacterium]|nr:hypothetical protein [Candidatus Brocadiaceae bacterium]